MRCVQNLSFPGEEATHSINDLNFPCGAGQYVKRFVDNSDYYENICANNRDWILRESLLLVAGISNVTDECWFLMSCFLFGTFKFGTLGCNLICNGSFQCRLWIQIKCNLSHYLILPILSILESHVKFVYTMNRTVFYYYHNNVLLLPDFICYQVQQCSFLSFTVKIFNLTRLDIRNIGLINIDQIVWLFHT